jgi:hypothetical protein
MLTVRDAIPRTYVLATAEFNTIRLRLLKLGARVIEMASRGRLAFAAACSDALTSRQRFADTAINYGAVVACSGQSGWGAPGQAGEFQPVEVRPRKGVAPAW